MGISWMWLSVHGGPPSIDAVGSGPRGDSGPGKAVRLLPNLSFSFPALFPVKKAESLAIDFDRTWLVREVCRSGPPCLKALVRCGMRCSEFAPRRTNTRQRRCRFTQAGTPIMDPPDCSRYFSSTNPDQRQLSLTGAAFALIVGESEGFGCGKQIASYPGLVRSSHRTLGTDRKQ